MIDRITFFQSYYDAVADLPAEQFKEILDAAFRYVFYGEEPKDLSPIAKGYFILMKPNLDSSLKKSASGKQGGSTTKADAKQAESKTEANVKQDASNIEEEVEEVEIEDRKRDKKQKKDIAPAHHKHGRFSHVLLTDQQYSDLVTKHGQPETDAAIQAVDDYCEQNGKSYKNYALVLEKWGYDAATRQNARSGTTGYVDAVQHRFDAVDDWYRQSVQGDTA